jgi:uncharacterized membrane protein YkoI
VGVGGAANALREGASTVEHSEADDGESDEPLTGTDAERAAATALEYTNAAYGVGGEVTEVEIGDDGAEYGVEVRLSDGRQVEVHLDAAFTATGDESDDD